jgi:hypothetical protein
LSLSCSLVNENLKGFQRSTPRKDETEQKGKEVFMSSVDYTKYVSSNPESPEWAKTHFVKEALGSSNPINAGCLGDPDARKFYEDFMLHILYVLGDERELDNEARKMAVTLLAVFVQESGKGRFLAVLTKFANSDKGVAAPSDKVVAMANLYFAMTPSPATKQGDDDTPVEPQHLLDPATLEALAVNPKAQAVLEKLMALLEKPKKAPKVQPFVFNDGTVKILNGHLGEIPEDQRLTCTGVEKEFQFMTEAEMNELSQEALKEYMEACTAIEFRCKAGVALVEATLQQREHAEAAVEEFTAMLKNPNNPAGREVTLPLLESFQKALMGEDHDDYLISLIFWLNWLLEKKANDLDAAALEAIMIKQEKARTLKEAVKAQCQEESLPLVRAFEQQVKPVEKLPTAKIGTRDDFAKKTADNKKTPKSKSKSKKPSPKSPSTLKDLPEKAPTLCCGTEMAKARGKASMKRALGEGAPTPGYLDGIKRFHLTGQAVSPTPGASAGVWNASGHRAVPPVLPVLPEQPEQPEQSDAKRHKAEPVEEKTESSDPDSGSDSD